MKRQGISLITLVITIVIVIILAGAVILNLADKNPIKDATKAVVIENIDTFRTELMLKLTSNSIFDTENINALTKDDILKYIPSMENRKVGGALYTDILVVSEGELKVDGTKANDAIESKKLSQEQYDWIVEALGNNVFNAQTYSIKYYLNDGTENYAESSKIHNVKYSILANSTGRENYGFTGWNTASDGTGTQYNAGDEYTENAELTLYAQWKANTFTITYYKNDGTEEAKTEVKNADVAYEIASGDFTRTGYTFNGWNTKADGTGTDYAVGDSYTENAELKLYAKWRDEASVAKVKANPSKYYGVYVNYIPKNGCTLNWRVFYADSTNIYLIAEDYVPNSYLTATGLTKSTHTKNNLKNYCVYSNISRDDLVARLTTSSYYTEFKDEEGKASSVVGAPTLEMYKDSYNEVNTDTTKQMNILSCTAGQTVAPGIDYDDDNKANAKGYVSRFGNSGNYAYDIVIPTDANKRELYIRTSAFNAEVMWLASFSAYHADNVMGAHFGGNVYSNGCKMPGLGLRPLVTLNSGVKLVDPDGDGVYDLV